MTELPQILELSLQSLGAMVAEGGGAETAALRPLLELALAAMSWSFGKAPLGATPSAGASTKEVSRQRLEQSFSFSKAARAAAAGGEAEDLRPDASWRGLLLGGGAADLFVALASGTRGDVEMAAAARAPLLMLCNLKGERPAGVFESRDEWGRYY